MEAEGNNQTVKEQTALISFAVCVFLAINKAMFGYMSNTSLLFLDAAHSLVDSLTSVLAYVSIRIGRIESKEQFKLVHQVENLAAILISFFILFGAYEVFKRALEPKLLFDNIVPNFPLAIVGTLISLGASYFMSKYKIHIGNKTNSPALVADGYDSYMDVYSSGAVLISLLGSLVGIGLNKIAGVLIAIMIAKVGVDILSKSARRFLKGLYQDMESAEMNNIEQVGHARMAVDIRKYYKRLKNLWKYTIVALIVVYLASGIFVVESDEEGVVKRFGVHTGEIMEPGLHYHLPWPVEAIIKTKVTQVNRLELGFRLEKTPYSDSFEPEFWESVHTTDSYTKVSDESMMVTGDENIVDVNMIVQYRIRDSAEYLFNTREPHRVIRDAVETATREVIGRKSIDEALTGGKMMIQSDVESIAQETLDAYGAGLDILAVQLQDVHPPSEVAASFKDVASAREDKNRIINDARAYQNDVLPKARGNAEKIVQDAQAYRTQRINTAMGDVERFMKVYEEYKKHMDTTRTRIYIETLENTLPQTKLFIIDAPDNGGGSLDYSKLILLNQLAYKEQKTDAEPDAVNPMYDPNGYDMSEEEEYWSTADTELTEDELMSRIEKGPLLL
ncbi:MAG: FtsH protease activity modulator HflK [Candidatus Altiarchaeota archaeon]